MTSETVSQIVGVVQAVCIAFAVCHLQWQIVKLRKEKTQGETPGPYPPPPRPAPPPPPRQERTGEKTLSAAQALREIAIGCGVEDPDGESVQSLREKIKARICSLSSQRDKAERYRREFISLAGLFLPELQEVLENKDPARVGSQLRRHLLGLYEAANRPLPPRAAEAAVEWQKFDPYANARRMLENSFSDVEKIGGRLEEETRRTREGRQRCLDALWDVYFYVEGIPPDTRRIGCISYEEVAKEIKKKWDDSKALREKGRQAQLDLHGLAADFPGYHPNMWTELEASGEGGAWLRKMHREYMVRLSAANERQKLMLRHGFKLEQHAGSYVTLKMYYGNKWERAWHGKEGYESAYLDTLLLAEKEGKKIMPIDANEIGD